MDSEFGPDGQHLVSENYVEMWFLWMGYVWSLIYLMRPLLIGVLSYLIYRAFIRRLKQVKPGVWPTPVKTMFIMGSGGHTMEMLRLISGLHPDKFTPRVYVLARSDSLSKDKIIRLEIERATPQSSYSFVEVHRIREVGQGWISTIIYGLPLAIIHSIQCVYNNQPQFILCNGPGICVPIVYVAWAMRILGQLSLHIAYSESVCRVTSLSLTGKIVFYFVDYFFVQWNELNDMYRGQVIFSGRTSSML